MNPEAGYNPELEKSAEEAPHEIPENVTRLTKYEKVRLVDIAYEDPKSLESLPPEELEEKITEFEAMPEYQVYHDLPLNFSNLEHAAEKFAESDEAEGNEKLADDLKRVIIDIKFSVSRYYKSVMVFERTEMNKFRLDPEEHLIKMKQVDGHRTLMHNRLIDDVVSYTRLCNKIIPEKTDYKFEKKDMFDPHLILDLRSKDDNTHGVARRRIATWAFLNERGVHIDKAVEYAKEILANQPHTA